MMTCDRVCPLVVTHAVAIMIFLRRSISLRAVTLAFRVSIPASSLGARAGTSPQTFEKNNEKIKTPSVFALSP